MIPEPPSGTVTFLFTDIEGSSRLWESEPARMANALAQHDRLCRSIVESHGGHVVKMIGDGLHAAFDDPVAAVVATLQLQYGVAKIAGNAGIAFRMRCGLHAGLSQLRDGDYFGTAVNRAARIAGAAHGGQVLLSQAVVDQGKGRFPDGVGLKHLGRVRLRDLAAPEDVWQVLHAELAPTFPALRSLDATPNNLPQQLTSFIGGEQALADVRQLLDSKRLVTLTGSGGCGKTRLALQVAADRLPSFPDGVWLIELAALADPGLVPQSVATVLGLQEHAGASLTQTLTEHLQSRQLLLLLDNAEHLLAACAQFADAVLRHCPQVVLLVSSREGLGIAGEQAYRVPSLSVPDLKRDVTPESLSPYESVRLFVERARLQLPRFVVTTKIALALASICTRLDGIPLAIELAAARVRSLSVEEINQRLDQRFLLLTGGSRTALPRQQTLRSLIDWSYDLLNAPERAMLCRLAVFTGGWTLQAAEHICCDERVDATAVLDILAALVDKNLIVVEERFAATRYRLLETVRQYARDRLLESGATGTWRGRHLAYFATLAEDAAPKLRGADQLASLERLETEHDNVRSALAWSAADAGPIVDGLRLAGAHYYFWYVRGYTAEGRAWFQQLLAAATDAVPAAIRAKACNGAGVMAWRQGDYPAARASFERAHELYRQLGDRRGVASSLSNLGLVASDQCDFTAARTMYEESLAIDRELGESRGISIVLNNLGIVAYHQGDYAAARALHEESLALRRELGDRLGVAMSLNNLGMVAGRQGDIAAARAVYAESMAVRRELGDRAGIASSVQGLGSIAFALNAPHRAACLWGAAARMREETGSSLSEGDSNRYAEELVATRIALGGDAPFDAAWAQGRAMTLEQAINFALDDANA